MQQHVCEGRMCGTITDAAGEGICQLQGVVCTDSETVAILHYSKMVVRSSILLSGRLFLHGTRKSVTDVKRLLLQLHIEIPFYRVCISISIYLPSFLFLSLSLSACVSMSFLVLYCTKGL